jgi:hypothetical protein
MVGGRSVTLLGVFGLVVVGCGGEDPIQAAAEVICDAIDAEVSDEVAFGEFELAVARERRNGVDEDDLRATLDERCGRVITAITAAAEPSVDLEQPDPEPEEEPSVDPVDLHDLVWSDQDWTSACVESGESTAMDLTQGSEPGVLWSNVGPDGEFSTAGMNYIVDTDSVVYGDITGDDLEEAILASECFFGNDYGSYVEVWSHDEDGQPVQLPPVIEFTKWDGVIDSFEVLEGTLRINTSEPAPGEETPHLNGYPVVVATDWSFDGEAWVPDEVSRTDTTPAPEPQPQPAPEPEPEPAPAPGSTACEQLGFEGAEEDWCAETIRSMEECYVEVENDPNWIEYEAGLYEHAVTGLITTCDI